MELTLQERLLIANQLKMLEKLYPDEADYYSKHRKAIENGYKLHYAWLVEHFSDEMTEEECREVLDILDMYRVLTFSYQKLKDKSGIDEQDIRFSGFDGNNETNQYSYVQYFVIDLERYNELRYGGEYPNFKSHCPMTDKYRQMLRAWKNYKDKFELSKEQIKEILEA